MAKKKKPSLNDYFIETLRIFTNTLVSIGTGMLGTYIGDKIGTYYFNPGNGTFYGGIVGSFVGGLSGGLFSRFCPLLEIKPLQIRSV